MVVGVQEAEGHDMCTYGYIENNFLRLVIMVVLMAWDRVRELEDGAPR